MRSMSDTLANSKAFTFETSERFDVSPTGGEKKVLHFTRKVTVRRPNGLFFEIHGTGDTALELTAYYDGRTLTLSEKPDGKWAQTTVPGTLDEMLDDVARRFGLPVPIGDVVYSSPYDAFIGGSTKGGLVGRETIDGVPCVKLDYADDLVQVTLWLPDFRPGAAPPARARLQAVSHAANRGAYVHQLEPRRAGHRRDVRVPAAGRPPSSEFGDFSAALVSRLMPSRGRRLLPQSLEPTRRASPRYDQTVE